MPRNVIVVDGHFCLAEAIVRPISEHSGTAISMAMAHTGDDVGAQKRKSSR